MIKLLGLYYIVTNVIAFFMYGNDKQRAKNHAWRIPERNLLAIAVLGGALGAFLGMRIFHHKTKHFIFCFLVPACVLGHGLICYIVLGH